MNELKTAKYELVDDNYVNKRLNLIGQFDEDIKSIIIERNIDSILINSDTKLEGGTIDFLSKLPNLKCLYLRDLDISDITVLENLTQLEVLYVSGCSRIKKACDFSLLSKLRDLRVEWLPSYDSIHKCLGLEYLRVDKYYKKNLKQFNNIKLKTLELIRSNIVTLEGVDNFKELENLTIYQCRKLVDIHSISTLNLEMIDIETCKAIETLNPILEITTLKEIKLDKCGRFASSTPLTNMKGLLSLKMGDSYFDDGDISSVASLVGVDVWLKNKKHYSHKFDQIEKCFSLKSK